ncbi:ABC transporter substrate-binding protein [Allostreptomyces psammosilenae]|uniref:Iron complex transport system substrate-binding protein n=1 Tax=Allostreptomyces psammosilenae TaxID=1892865 RepID=A0A853A1G4_9ACTN|nr:iron-siderophore ABC transporter substrate-binding protein [Allostreptomyces psammosilenae]NYI04362.1 iron complex transport system substrate-binding protein [Allostreptomyces psammosilenae]
MNRLLRALATAGTAVALGLSVAACGSGTVSDPGSNASGDQAGESAAGASGEITVQTARGPVTLPGTATKVVALEWAYVEELVALGVTPTGVADVAGYGQWVTAPSAKLPTEGVTDVGTRAEPSVEQIRALDPDLIVAEENAVAANFDQLNEIAPVLSFDYTVQPQLETMKTNFTELAKAVGQEEKAAEVLGAIDTKAAEVADRLEAAGQAGLGYALAQGFTMNGAPSIRMFTDEAMGAQVLNLAGLTNSWTGEPDEWGFSTVTVENLTQVPSDATFLYVAGADDNPFTGVLADNPVWQGLDFVEQDRALALDPGTWFFGGPLSAVQILDETAKALQV